MHRAFREVSTHSSLSPSSFSGPQSFMNSSLLLPPPSMNHTASAGRSYQSNSFLNPKQQQQQQQQLRAKKARGKGEKREKGKKRMGGIGEIGQMPWNRGSLTYPLVYPLTQNLSTIASLAASQQSRLGREETQRGTCKSRYQADIFQAFSTSRPPLALWMGFPGRPPGPPLGLGGKEGSPSR
jgi:hypothetical protein